MREILKRCCPVSTAKPRPHLRSITRIFATIYDVGEHYGQAFIAVELVVGKTVDRLISRHGLKLNEALKYSVQITDALAVAHSAGIVHRDLKPGNVMITGLVGELKTSGRPTSCVIGRASRNGSSSKLLTVT